MPTRPQLGFQRFVRRNYPDGFSAYLLADGSPWTTRGPRMHFYRPDSVKLEGIASLDDVERRRPPAFLVITDSCASLQPRDYACEPLYRSLPCFLHGLSGGLTHRIPAWDLSRCAAPPCAPARSAGVNAHGLSATRDG